MLEPIRAALEWTDDQMVASAREFYKTGAHGHFAELASRLNRDPIIGTVYDQAVPDGVSNPYWEIIRHTPTHDDFLNGGLRPTGFWLGGDTPEMVRLGLWREHLVYRYAWSIPSPGDIAWLKERLDGQGVLEIGAGTGYWAWQMRQYGIDVLAYDTRSPLGRNPQVGGGPYAPVGHGGVPRAAQAGDRALFLCWPTYRHNWAHRALKLYEGDTVIYVGEGNGGCTADDGFHRELDENWTREALSPHHVSFFGIWCKLALWRRNAR